MYQRLPRCCQLDMDKYAAFSFFLGGSFVVDLTYQNNRYISGIRKERKTGKKVNTVQGHFIICAYTDRLVIFSLAGNDREVR